MLILTLQRGECGEVGFWAIFGAMRISQAACEYNGACLLLQMEEKRRKYSISSDNSDTTDSKSFHLGLLQGKPLTNY